MKFQPTDHVAFDTDAHGAIQTTEFDFDAVDEALGFVHQSPPEAREQAAELFRNLMAWCFADGRPLRASMVRFTAICAGLRPDLLDNKTGHELALELNVTKQAMSRQAVRFEDAFGFKFARSRSKESRQRMAAARRGGPNRNLPKHDESNDPNQPA
jgi:hypothetical protein